jgi:hypothetical protein
VNGPRVVIVVLAVLALLFVVGLMFGARDEERPDPSDSWVDSLGGLIPKPAVDADDIRADCLESDTFVIPATQTCVARIEGPNRGVNEVRLSVTSGGAVAVTADRPDMLEEERTMQPGEERAFDVYPDGMSLQFACIGVALGGPSCTVALE